MADFVALSPVKNRYMLQLGRVTITSGLDALPARTAAMIEL